MTIIKSEVNSFETQESILKREIPIQNIYYMISYAYENFKINQDILRESVDFKNIFDLFARILIGAINRLVRRGFYKEYITKDEDTSHVKGKINFINSIKRRTTVYKKLNCQYDDFNTDVLFNQIIKTTINKLIRSNINENLKKKLKKLKPFFNNVSSIDLDKQDFKSFLWSKNNKYYRLIIDICELIFHLSLPDDSKYGKVHFKNLLEKYGKEMANLFEKFVFNFYKKEFKEFGEFRGLKVHKPRIEWNLDINYDEGKEYLPKMRTDIILEYENKQLIIDTKFYKNILSTYHGKKVLNSSHLYQIYSYVNNSNFNGEISGMLLYASVGEDINYQYKIQDKIIRVKSLNLNQDLEKIDVELKEIFYQQF